MTSPPSPAADAADFLSGKTVGIIGCGHLGRTLALELLGSGLPGDGLLVSYGGNASTLEKIREAGLQERISSNEDICALSDIVFISVRPQSIGDLGRISFRKGAVVVSCAAGVSTSSLKSIFGVDAFRVMPSGPDTIRQRKGIAAVYPKSDLLSGLLFCLGLKAYQLEDEDLMHLFTTGVCLPAALLAAEDLELEIEGAVETIAGEYAQFREIHSWAREVLPDFSSSADKEGYIRRMCTRGGITEAIVQSLDRRSTFLEALHRGIARSREISDSMQVLE